MVGCKHLFIPDTQVRSEVPINHFYWLAYYAMDKEPDKIIWAGDHFDMPSLSSYDKKGSKSTEGRRVRKDISAGERAMDVTQNIWAKHGFEPVQHITLGNHCNRWNRALEENPAHFEGMFPNDDPFQFERWGIQSHEFLKPVRLDGVNYCHYFPQSARGQVVQTKRGAPSALAQVQRQLRSATAGHQQGLDVAIIATDTGLARGLIAGSFYLHNESYLGPINSYWRGLILKHDVHHGNYNLCEVDMKWLRNKYSKLEPAGRKRA